MSIVVSRKSLTEEQAYSIARGLILQPEEKFRPGKHFGGGQPKEGIPMYHKVGDNVYLPYTFAKCYLNVKPEPKPPCSIPFKGTPRPNQVSKIEEAMQQLKEYGTTTLQLDTAYGKTFISTYLASQLGRLTLVLFNMNIVKDQWIKTFQTATDCLIWDTTKKPPPSINVIVCSTGRLSHIPEEILSQVGTVIMDESHRLCVKDAISAILKVTPEYLIASSYTYERGDNSHTFMDAVMGLHRIHGRLDINITAVTCYTGFKYGTLPKNKTGGPDWAEIVKMIANNEERNKFVCDLVQANLHRKIMVLTPLIELTKHICQMLIDRGIKADYITSKKSKYQSGNVLVGTVAKISTAFDEKNYCPDYDGVPSNMLINMASNKERNLIVQTAGRMKRCDNTYMVDIVDDITILKRHVKERAKIYEEEGYAMMEINGLFQVPEYPAIDAKN